MMPSNCSHDAARHKLVHVNHAPPLQYYSAQRQRAVYVPQVSCAVLLGSHLASMCTQSNTRSQRCQALIRSSDYCTTTLA
jgi:hypothetical protein